MSGATYFSPWWGFAFIVLLYLSVATGLVKNVILGPRVSARLCMAGGIVVWTLISNSPEKIVYLTPLAILAFAQWGGPFPEPSDGHPLATLPDWSREALSFVAMTVGVIVLISSLAIGGEAYFATAYLNVDYTPLFIGLVLCLTSIVLVLTNLSRHNFASSIIISYSLVIIANVALTVIAKSMDYNDPYISEGLIISSVGAMLLVQVIRHFQNPNALLKIAETYLGGIIVAFTADLLLQLSKPSVWFGIFFLPALLVGVPVILFGLYLIWRKDVWLTRLRPPL